jgi:hypothetical protein
VCHEADNAIVIILQPLVRQCLKVDPANAQFGLSHRREIREDATIAMMKKDAILMPSGRSTIFRSVV